jgi:hypothetical protein
MILDGRNRYAAAKAAGHEFSVDDFVQWEGTVCRGRSLGHLHEPPSSPTHHEAEARLKRNPSLSDREIARQIGVSNSTVGAARDRLTNSPEVRRYENFKRKWKKFSDAECMTFIRDNLADIKYLVAEGSKNISLRKGRSRTGRTQ